jgi:Ni/Co efflux regulator RcnB
MKTSCALAVAIAGLLAAAPVASQPPWAGGGKGDKSEKSQRSDKSDKGDRRAQSDNRKDRQRDGDDRSQRDRARPSAAARQHFEDRHRTAVHDYYNAQFRRGWCPPGLAKKQNGCMPPGQAKKWTVGRPLPREVIFYNLEPALVRQFGPPPAGHRYVRVASDILLIAVGTGMVIDAIQDLGRM